MDPNETHQKDSKRRKNPKFYKSMGVMCSDRLDGSVVLFFQVFPVSFHSTVTRSNFCLLSWARWLASCLSVAAFGAIDAIVSP